MKAGHGNAVNLRSVFFHNYATTMCMDREKNDHPLREKAISRRYTICHCSCVCSLRMKSTLRLIRTGDKGSMEIKTEHGSRNTLASLKLL